VIEKKRLAMVGAAVLLGLGMGFGLSHLQMGGQTYCEGIEKQVRANQTFNGTVDCFEPGVIPVNISEEVENSTELRCVCRHSFNGQVRLLPISESKS
jgi:hypothetical protein